MIQMTKIIMVNVEEAKPGLWYAIGTERLICVGNCYGGSGRVVFVNFANEQRKLNTQTPVEYLPDCTGWDWNPTPTYAELHAACDIKVGDKVRVTCESSPMGYGLPRWEVRKQLIGMSGTVAKTDTTQGFYVLIGDRDGWFPCTSLEKIEPTYRPFANAAEFAPHRERWIRTPGSETFRRVEYYQDTTVNGMSYDSLFRNRTFDDGSPCGVEVTS